MTEPVAVAEDGYIHWPKGSGLIFQFISIAFPNTQPTIADCIRRKDYLNIRSGDFLAAEDNAINSEIICELLG